MGGTSHRLLVGRLDALFDVFGDLWLGHGLIRRRQLQPQLLLEAILGFSGQISAWDARLRIYVDLEGDECRHEALLLTDHHDV